MQRGFFGLSFIYFGSFVLFFCVFVLLFVKGPKRLFSCNFRCSFSILFPQKACLWNPSFFLFCFIFISFCLAFQIPFFLTFCPSTLFWKTLPPLPFVFLFLPFSFHNVCLFLLKQTFLTSPFWNPSCFHFWLLIFLLFLFLFSWCTFLPFCFYVGFVLGMFLFSFVFFLFCFQSTKKSTVFPAILVFFSCYVG